MISFRTKVKVGMAKYNTLSAIQQVDIYRNIDFTTQINYHEHGLVEKTTQIPFLIPLFWPHSANYF